MEDDSIVRQVEVQVDLRATDVRVWRHGVPDTSFLELGDAHDELRALDSAGVDVLVQTPAIGLLRRAELGDVRSVARDMPRGTGDVGRIAHEVKASWLFGRITLEEDLAIAASDVQSIPILHRVRFTAHADAARAADVEHTQLAP